ncbi:MAG: MFS transporter [Clostridiales bacterium]|nr:MFS transporter [Clostridiales bacterium]
MAEDRKGRTKLYIGYGLGFLCDPCCYNFIALYQILFLTKVAGLSAAHAGIVSSISMMADAVFGLIVGKFSDNLRSRFGRRRPLLLAVTFTMPLAFSMMFRTIEAGEGAKLAYYMSFGTLFWISFAVCFVSYVALGADVAKDYDDRIILDSYSKVFSTIAAIVATALPLTAIDFMMDRGVRESDAWFSYALLLAFIAFAGLFTCWNVTRGYEKPVFGEPEKQGISGFVRDCVQLMTLKPYRKIILSKISSIVSNITFSGTLVFFISFVMEGDPRFTVLLYTLSNIFILFLVPFIAKTSLRMGKRSYVVISQLAAALIGMLFGIIGIRRRIALVIYMLVFVFGQSSFWQLCNSNLYDMTDWDFYKFRRRREGNIMALQSFLNTMGSAVAIKLYTWMLEFSGFSATAATQPDAALTMLKILFIWVPSFAALAAGYIMWTYKVDKHRFMLLKEHLGRLEEGEEGLCEEKIAQIEEMFT